MKQMARIIFCIKTNYGEFYPEEEIHRIWRIQRLSVWYLKGLYNQSSEIQEDLAVSLRYNLR